MAMATLPGCSGSVGVARDQHRTRALSPGGVGERTTRRYQPTAPWVGWPVATQGWVAGGNARRAGGRMRPVRQSDGSYATLVIPESPSGIARADRMCDNVTHRASDDG